MKNWVTEINPKQALLILLLTNKKDTPNLVRFRPILLQGIAVNRITRAAELDMEIEVIERENLNKFSQVHLIATKLVINILTVWYALSCLWQVISGVVLYFAL